MRRLLNRVRLFSTFRYTDPSLHPGRWDGPEIMGGKGHPVAVWRLLVGHPICVGSNHAAVVCAIGPGMAHVDTCVCGAKRYGVFGSWS